MRHALLLIEVRGSLKLAFVKESRIEKTLELWVGSMEGTFIGGHTVTSRQKGTLLLKALRHRYRHDQNTLSWFKIGSALRGEFLQRQIQ